jgi:hypothetical protein
MSNANSAFVWSVVVKLWRPSTGANLGNIYDQTNTGSGLGTTETASSFSDTSNQSQTSQANDIIVVELWRYQAAPQGMGTSYTNTVFYDGTTEGSSSSNAAFIEFSTTIVMVGDTFDTPPVGYPRRRSYKAITAQ